MQKKKSLDHSEHCKTSPEIFDASDELFERGIIIFDKEFDEQTCSQLISKIILLNLMDKTGKKPIILLINSQGGDMYSCFGAIDVIESSRRPVYTVCIGSAFSSGATMLLAGKKRYALPSTRLMIHQHWISFDESVTKLELNNENAESDRLFEQTILFYMKKTGLTRKKVTTLLEKDTFLSAQEALALNIVDEVGWDILTWVK